MKLQLRTPLFALASLILSFAAFPQAPTGTISGVVSDESGAVIPNASVTVTNKATSFSRTLTAGGDGGFAFPSLLAGTYSVKATVSGFRTLERDATVETGATTTVDMKMSLGATKDVVTVEAATAQIEYERHAIDGVVTRNVIQDLPLNGRSYLQLASIEPGVTVSPGTTSQYNALYSVSMLGGDSGKTAISIDGGPIRNAVEGGSQMNFSQEVVEEFQVSSVNYDLSTDITSVGSVNIVTRTGSNDFHGSGYFFFRDHNMAAYPSLVRNPLNPNPFFARRDPGFWLGGPIKKDKLFFFFNYEYMNQVQSFSVRPNLPSVAGLGGNFGSPYAGKTLSGRFDYRINQNHTLFARYSHDGNHGFGPAGSGAPLPSNWLRNVNWSDQSVMGVTSALKPTLVNDFRFTYAFWSNRNLFPTSSDCPNCVGLLGPQISFAAPSSNFQAGDTENATQGRDLRRLTWEDGLTWQKGSHRMKFGTLLEHEPGTGFWGYCDPACAEVFAPEFVQQQLGPLTALLFPNLPKTISSNQDLLNLPFAGAIVGIGDPSQPPPYNLAQAKSNNRYRFYFQDTWKLRPKFTLNYGLAYEYESNLFNEDLPKPAYLTPLYGADLSPTHPNHGNISPLLGFAWNVGKNNKTVIRGGGGIYYDTESLYRRLQERSEIGPVGNGRVQYPSSGFVNTFPGILNLQTQQPIPMGAPLQTGFTTMTLGQFEQIVQSQGPGIAAKLSTPVNGVTPVDIAKSGAELLPRNYPVQRSYQLSLGVQRELSKDLVVSADFVRRAFVDLLYGGTDIDVNRFNRYINGVQTPVIPICTAAQSSTPGVECSNGPVTFWMPGGRSTYTALLVKADKRFSNRYQFTASYALQSEYGLNGIHDLGNYDSSWGPQGARNVLNIVATVSLPWGFQLGLISTTSSVGPIMPVISGIDLNGNGSGNTPLPGLSYNCLNRGCGVSQLETAVSNWDSTYAGKKDATGKTMPKLTLPANFTLGRAFNSQDLRLTKVFSFRDRYKFSIFGEMFNVFNYANYGGYTWDPSSSAFGIATQRVTQVFGNGGPRAVQVGGRFSF